MVLEGKFNGGIGLILHDEDHNGYFKNVEFGMNWIDIQPSEKVFLHPPEIEQIEEEDDAIILVLEVEFLLLRQLMEIDEDAIDFLNVDLIVDVLGFLTSVVG